MVFTKLDYFWELKDVCKIFMMWNIVESEFTEAVTSTSLKYRSGYMDNFTRFEAFQ